MSHNYERGDWKKEFILSSISGFAYGGTTIAVGHPFNTITTRMQAKRSAIGLGYVENAQRLYMKDGVRGFYRGFFPPFFGAMMYRSA